VTNFRLSRGFKNFCQNCGLAAPIPPPYAAAQRCSFRCSVRERSSTKKISPLCPVLTCPQQCSRITNLVHAMLSLLSASTHGENCWAFRHCYRQVKSLCYLHISLLWDFCDFLQETCACYGDEVTHVERFECSKCFLDAWFPTFQTW